MKRSNILLVVALAVIVLLIGPLSAMAIPVTTLDNISETFNPNLSLHLRIRGSTATAMLLVATPNKGNYLECQFRFGEQRAVVHDNLEFSYRSRLRAAFNNRFSLPLYQPHRCDHHNWDC